MSRHISGLLFFFNDTATTEIYTLSLHDALPISFGTVLPRIQSFPEPVATASTSTMLSLPSAPLADPPARSTLTADRKSTRLNSSHANISYAVFCLKKKKQTSELHSRKHMLSRLP